MPQHLHVPVPLKSILCFFLVSLCVLCAAAHAEEVQVLNPNSASVDALDALPGVDRKLAMSIVQYREMMGDLQTVEELKEVDGMTPEIFESIKQYLSVEAASTDCGC